MTPHAFTTGDATGIHVARPLIADDDACAIEGLAVVLDVAKSRKADPMSEHERCSRLMALALGGMTDPTLSAERQLRYRVAFAAFTRPIAGELADLTDAMRVMGAS